MTKNRLVKIVEENLNYRKRIIKLEDNNKKLSFLYDDLQKKYKKLKKDFDTLLLYYTLNEEMNEKEIENDK